jgi:hypothetical protein
MRSAEHRSRFLSPPPLLGSLFYTGSRRADAHAEPRVDPTPFQISGSRSPMPIAVSPVGSRPRWPSRSRLERIRFEHTPPLTRGSRNYLGRVATWMIDLPLASA